MTVPDLRIMGQGGFLCKTFYIPTLDSSGFVNSRKAEQCILLCTLKDHA